MEHIKDNIYLENSIVFELLNTMFYINCQDKLNSNPYRKRYVSSSTLEWMASIDAQLDQDIRNEIKIFFDLDSYCAHGLIPLIYNYGVYQDIQEFIFYFLTKVDSLEIVKSFLGPVYTMNAVGKDNLCSETAIEYIKNMNIPEPEKWKLTYFFTDVNGTKERLFKLISDFYRLYFKKFEKSIAEKYTQDRVRMRKELDSSMFENLGTLLANEIDVIKSFDQVVIFPIHYYGVSLTSIVVENNLLSLFGMDRLKLIQMDQVDDSLDSLKAISDEKRIKIIRMLNQKDLYGYEIGQRLGLSDSTVSHHLSVLVRAKVIEPSRKENRVYYKVNKTMIEDILDRVKLLLT